MMLDRMKDLDSNSHLKLVLLLVFRHCCTPDKQDILDEHEN